MITWTDRAPRALLRFFVLTLVVGLASGCGIFSPEESNDGGGGGGTVTEFPDATTPQQLITNFVNAYEDMNIVEYDRALHESFTFWFSPNEPGLAGSSWDRATDIGSTTRMFEGAEGVRVNESGEEEVYPAVQRIELTLTPYEPWTSEFDDGAEFAEADFRGGFTVNMSVHYTGSNTVSQVTGTQRFYIKDVNVDGPDPLYKIYAWKDLGLNS